MLTIIIIILILSLLIFNIWNLITLNQIRKIKVMGQSELSDGKYYELKYKIDFLVAVVSIVIGVVGFLGYNSLSDIKTNLSKRIAFIDSSFANIDTNILKKDSIANSLNNRINDINDILTNSDFKVKNYKSKIDSIQRKIDEINNKNIIKQNYYISETLVLTESKRDTIIYFDKLKSNVNDKLPVFKKPPILIPVTTNGAFEIVLHQITDKSFRAFFSTTFRGENVVETKTYNFRIVIFED